MRPDFHLWRAEIYERWGDREKAISDYYHYLLWRPDGAEKDMVTQKIQEYLHSS
jgi:regulator of sirC expression with transglutaminase-like and TPR domain